MDLKVDFEQAVIAVGKIDFSNTEDEDIKLFETTTRYLGGLLAAYDLTDGKPEMLLEKAVQLGDMLYAAFDTSNRMPVTRWKWERAKKDVEMSLIFGVLVAELGSLFLEFTRISQLTGDDKYFDAVQRIADKFEKVQPHTKLPGMWPTVVNTMREDFGDDTGFTSSAMADSVYEYLPKVL
ncbi:glycoside hydrolase [Calycina marina]|uniref:alpha-1,2-Mannosidase n=1 Tax=Calycina marina TaxID=1763456 RepID=A0A9P8CCC3_9HELO|nr:glycoside hydrolase [Calycina marina]